MGGYPIGKYPTGDYPTEDDPIGYYPIGDHTLGTMLQLSVQSVLHRRAVRGCY